ncbi:MAG: helix-turn-helix domain-containing protein [Planctomycetes bacterium]|nr:helix-turn-helix domain-containing protein [Planctomycetota bacterium]
MMLTVKQVAERLNLSQAAIYRYVASSQLECHRFGNAIRISDAQLTDFLKRTKAALVTDTLPISEFKHL